MVDLKPLDKKITMLINVQLIELNPLNNIHPRGPIKRPNKARQQKCLGNANKVKYIF
jgi:hypothetical protein